MLALPMMMAPGASLHIGLVADIHHADREVRNNRYYRQALGRLRRAVDDFNRERLDFVVEMGDLIDEADTVEAELALVHQANAVLAQANAERHYVLGNHCIWTLTKPEFLGAVGRKESYYSFDRSGWHFVVLDACFKEDATPYGRRNNDWRDSWIPALEQTWIEQDLARTRLPSIVFAHQRLDTEGDLAVKNAADVRRVLESSGKVAAVFQGHHHEGGYSLRNGIHYLTLVSVIEEPDPAGGAHAIVELQPDRIRVRGFGRQQSMEWRREPPSHR
jgi:alkaline phosphatase